MSLALNHIDRLDDYIERIHEAEFDAWCGYKHSRDSEELDSLRKYAEDAQQAFENLETHLETIVDMLYSEDKPLCRVDLDFILSKMYTEIKNKAGCVYDMPSGLPAIQRKG